MYNCEWLGWMAMLRALVVPLFRPQCQNSAMTRVILQVADIVTESGSGLFIMRAPQTSAPRAYPLGWWQTGPGQAILCPLSYFNSPHSSPLISGRLVCVWLRLSSRFSNWILDTHVTNYLFVLGLLLKFLLTFTLLSWLVIVSSKNWFQISLLRVWFMSTPQYWLWKHFQSSFFHASV